MSAQDLEQQVMNCQNLPSLSTAGQEVLRLTDAEEPSPKDIKLAIEKDPTTVGKVLKTASSALYGIGKVSNIQTALATLGVKQVRSIVVSTMFQDMLGPTVQGEYFSALNYWRHSLATAVIARHLAQMRLPSIAEEAYCAGLLHNIGALAMDRFAPTDLSSAIRIAMEEQRPLREIQRELVGYDHYEVTQILVRRWSLSISLINCFRHYVAPAEAGDYKSIASLLALANQISHRAGFSTTGRTSGESLSQSLIDQLLLTSEQIDIAVNNVEAKVKEAEEALGQPIQRVAPTTLTNPKIEATALSPALARRLGLTAGGHTSDAA